MDIIDRLIFGSIAIGLIVLAINPWILPSSVTARPLGISDVNITSVDNYAPNNGALAVYIVGDYTGRGRYE